MKNEIMTEIELYHKIIKKHEVNKKVFDILEKIKDITVIALILAIILFVVSMIELISEDYSHLTIFILIISYLLIPFQSVIFKIRFKYSVK